MACGSVAAPTEAVVPTTDRNKRQIIPSSSKRAGGWGNQFDMALLAMEFSLQQVGVTTPHRKLTSVDLRPGLLNTEGGGDHMMQVHLLPDINGTDHHAVAPHQIIRSEDVQLGDVVIGLIAD